MIKEINTPDELVYTFSPAPNGVFNFEVRAANDAHIALTSGPEPSDPMYEVFIGGWSNTKSVIRKDRTKPDVVESETPGILSGNEFRKFWIRWQNGTITAGKGDESEPFLSFTDDKVISIGYVGICTGWGSDGTWRIEGVPHEIKTRDCGEFSNYIMHPSLYGFVEVEVRAPSNAHVALSCSGKDKMYEIVLGGWNNTMSAICYRQTPTGDADILVQEATPALLNAGEFRHFSIQWQSEEIRVEHRGRVLLSWTIKNAYANAFGISHIGVHTGNGATGTWRIHQVPLGFNMLALLSSRSREDEGEEELRETNNDDDAEDADVEEGGEEEEEKPEVPEPSAPPMADPDSKARWELRRNGEIPEGAVEGGVDIETDEMMYVARAEHEGAIIPGKFVPSHGLTYVAWGGGEHGKPEYEILCGCEVSWQKCSDENIPADAFKAGKTEDGEDLYIGRVNDGNISALGKVQLSHKVCYVPYGGREIAYPEYEVLVVK